MQPKSLKKNIPGGKDVACLKDYVDVIMGQSPPGASCNRHNVGAPLLNGPTEFTETFPIPIQFTTQGKKYSQTGDILFCVRGSTTGRMNIADQRYALGRGLAAIRHKQGVKYQRFAKALIDYSLGILLARCAGSTFPSIARDELEKLKVASYSLPEQKRIVAVLEVWDACLEKLTKKIELKKRIKKGLMQKLLAKKVRFQGCEGRWRYYDYKEMFMTVPAKKNQIPKDAYRGSGKYPVVDQGQSQIAGYTDEERVFDRTPIIVFGDHTRIIKWVNFPFVIGADGTQLLKTLPVCDQKYGFYALLNLRLPNLGYSRHFKIVKESVFHIPDDPIEQKKIATFLNKADDEIEVLENRKQILEAQKKYLLNNLITGQIRTPENLLEGLKDD